METAEAPKIPTTAQRKSPTPATEDRISYLPDEILAHILFLLPTKHAVATSVLSRRWKDVWTGVYNLHLDFNNRFGESEIVANAQEIRERRYLEFCRFVDTVLSRHKNLNSVRRFHFHFAMKDVGCKVRPNFWLQMGFSPDESQLEVMDVELRGDEWNDDPFSLRCLPESFYRLKNLKILKLAGVSLETRIGSIFLPSVRKLLLLYAVIKSCASLSKLISGCPVLETLQIESCRHSNKEENDTLNAFLPCLKKLTIIGDIFYHDHCIVIDAPSLEHLYLDEYPELQLSQDGSRPLQCLHSAMLEQGESGISNRGLTRLLAQISNAKVLCLSWRTLVITNQHLLLFWAPLIFVASNLNG
ncbi:unnamed protein product [Linum tenue]|uniref:F-box domain-containing protein n=1 Tax=Linum tenue TaxID=586396 RepID=A0AAV0P9I4_9ROSI|nr:unnamed protein product [Linum tenue]